MWLIWDSFQFWLICTIYERYEIESQKVKGTNSYYNFQMPKRELNIFYFPNFQTLLGYDLYHSEWVNPTNSFTTTTSTLCVAQAFLPFPPLIFSSTSSCSLCLSSALLTIISDNFNQLLVCLPFPSTSSFPLFFHSTPVCSLGNWIIKLHFGFKIHEGLLKFPP